MDRNESFLTILVLFLLTFILAGVLLPFLLFIRVELLFFFLSFQCAPIRIAAVKLRSRRKLEVAGSLLSSPTVGV